MPRPQGWSRRPGPTLVGVSWRFARRPSWILRHVIVLALVVLMVNLGMWQLRRLEDRRSHIDLLQDRQRVPVADVRDVVPADAAVDSPEIEAVEYRSVTAVGVYDAEGGVLVANRSYEGTPGAWVLTPLELGDGTAVAVNRGFIGFSRTGDLVVPAPPSGQVTVHGLVYASEERGRFGPADPPDGELDQLARADIARLEQQLPYDLLPAYVQLEQSTPPEEAANPTAVSEVPPLITLGAPDLHEGPHLSYAVQWFIFALIALVGYPILLRRMAVQEARERRAAALDEPGGEPDDIDRELEDLLRDP
jgi:surfeit locus 1 family protein